MGIGESTLLGHPVSFWLELQRRADEKFSFDYASLLTEIVDLRGKLSFYESRIDQLARFKNGER